ncbi:MAG: hypothetical protein R3A52_33260 [Polyangiales bacterium]
MLAHRLTAAQSHTCVRFGDARGWCWGTNGHGELGVDPRDGGRFDPRPTPIEDRAEPGARTLAGYLATAMITASGEVRLRGLDPAPPHTGAVHTEWSPANLPLHPTDLSLAGSLLCGVFAGEVRCLGRDEYGEIFTPHRVPHDSAVGEALEGLSRITAITLGGSALFAVRDDGAVLCVGSNEDGVCGAPSDHATLREVAGLPPTLRVAQSAHDACALTRSGEVWCWGGNVYNVLGDGTTQPRSTPARVGGLSAVTDLGMSSLGSACAVMNAQVYCWGWPVGPSRPGVDGVPRPTRVEGLDDVVEVALGSTYACALTRRDEVWCWGDRYLGQLGDGVIDNEPARAPVRVLLPRTE